MQHRYKVYMQNFISFMIGGSAFAIAVVLIFMIGPIIEGKYMPVTEDIEVTLLYETKEAMYFEAYGTKVRNCTLTAARILVDEGLSKLSKGKVIVVNDGIGPKDRALGTQNLGTWEITPKGKSLYVQAEYYCHPFWRTNIQLGEWHRG